MKSKDREQFPFEKKKDVLIYSGTHLSFTFHDSKERASVQYLQTEQDLQKLLKLTDLECSYKKFQIFPKKAQGNNSRICIHLREHLLK